MHEHHRFSCHAGLFRPRVGGPQLLFAGLAWALAATALAQDDAKFTTWSKLESSAEARAFREAVRAGTFDAASRTFLEEVALPQLTREENRSSIERVRRGIRENLLRDIGGEKASAEVNGVTMAFLDSLLAKEGTDPAVQFNAMLLLGELSSADRKPWPPATPVLSKVVADPKAPKALRIAACVGLTRHADAATKSADDQQRVAQDAVPAVLAVLEEPVNPLSRAETEWLTGRCLSMLPPLGPAKQKTVDAVRKVLDDKSRSATTRVRAAAAFGAIVGPGITVESKGMVESLRKVAVESLEQDVAAGDQRQLEQQYGGGPGATLPGAGISAMPQPGFAAAGSFDSYGQPMGATAGPQFIPREVCRRAAWRLSVLADVILSEDGKKGVAAAEGGPAQEARDLSRRLRAAAMTLDATPEETILRQVLDEFRPAAPAAEEKKAEGATDREPADGPDDKKAAADGN